jgi:hypothetical protein
MAFVTFVFSQAVNPLDVRHDTRGRFSRETCAAVGSTILVAGELVKPVLRTRSRRRVGGASAGTA